MKTISLIETNRSGRKMRIILKITAIRAIAVLVGLIV
jgi:exosortase/archaeosortase